MGRRGLAGRIAAATQASTSVSPPVIVGDMPNSGKKKRNSSGENADPGDGVDPALKHFLNAMKSDIMGTMREAVVRIETRLGRNEVSIANLEKKVEESKQLLGDKIAAEVAKQVGSVSISLFASL